MLANSYADAQLGTSLGRRERPIPIWNAGIVTALDALAAEQWEVRNAASLTFATLVLRTVGIRNVAKVNADASHVACCMCQKAKTDTCHSQPREIPHLITLQGVQMHGPM